MGEIVRFNRRGSPLPLPSARMVPKNWRGAYRWLAFLFVAAIAVGKYLGLDIATEQPKASAGEPVIGVAFVVDGDTIRIGQTRFRFFGTDAPESTQSCRDGEGSSYACGQDAKSALTRMTRGKTVQCDPRDIDQYGRTVAVCTADGTDLNAAVVEAGMAVAYRQFSSAYVSNETRARLAHRGLWAGSFEMPWDYRRDHRERRLY